LSAATRANALWAEVFYPAARKKLHALEWPGFIRGDSLTPERGKTVGQFNLRSPHQEDEVAFEFLKFADDRSLSP